MKKHFKNLGVYAKKNKTSIATGLGITMCLYSTYSAARATSKATLLLEERKLDLDVDELTKTEVIKTAGKCYIPTILSSAFGIYCILYSHKLSLKENATLMTAYTVSEKALRTYREEVINTVGEKKAREIHDRCAQRSVDDNPGGVIIVSAGRSKCYEAYTGRYFEGDIDDIRRKMNQLNMRLLSEGFITLNDFNWEVSLPNIKEGDDLGWVIEDGLIELLISATLDEFDKPCIVIDYKIMPKKFAR